jgi:hypothetical protein
MTEITQLNFGSASKVPCFIKWHHRTFEGILGGHGQSPDLPPHPAFVVRYFWLPLLAVLSLIISIGAFWIILTLK